MGVAILEPTTGVAQPRDSVPYSPKPDPEWEERIAKLLEEYGIEQIVFGIPLRLDGRSGDRARRARLFGEHLAERTGVPAELLEECWTSVRARLPGSDRARLGSIATALLHAWLLGDTPSPAGLGALVGALGRPDLTLRFDAAYALAGIGSLPAMWSLIDALASGDETAEIAAAALAHCRERESLDALIAAIDEPRFSEGVRRSAMRSLGRLGGPDALWTLRWVLETNSLRRRRSLRPMRIEAARALAWIGGEAALEILEWNAVRGDRAVRRACRELIDQL